jgi:hypothetical protein
MSQNLETIFVTIYQTSFLSEIIGAERIPVGRLAYFRGRLGNRIHELVLTEFSRLSKAGKINKAQLAKRIGRQPEQVTRWLGSPGNWTIETFSDLLLAMGFEPKISLIPLGGAEVYQMHEGANSVQEVFPPSTNQLKVSGRISIIGASKESIAREA